ncbi:hypothetical protein GF360_02150 [candidate division WWE3 bacterium]|nr:hypothetical protein [candidate division WWE3 bacterium]
MLKTERGEMPTSYQESLRKYSAPDAFEINLELEGVEGEAKDFSIGETFIEQELHDTSGEGLYKTPVNRLLNITALGKVIGQGATNTGVEVLGVEGLPEGVETPPLIAKALHAMRIEKGADTNVYHLHQSDILHRLGEKGVGPKYYGVALQESPVENAFGTPTRYFVPVMEKVGAMELTDLLEQPLTEAERKMLEDELRRVYSIADETTKMAGYTIGDHSVRIGYSEEEGLQAWIIDVGFVPEEIGLDFDVEGRIDRLMRYHEKVAGENLN